MSYSNSNLEIIWFRLYEPKNTLVFCFSFFHFDDFLTTFAKDLIQKPPVFITNIKSTHNFLHFHKNLRSKSLLKKVKKLRFSAADSDKCRKEKILNSLNLSNMARVLWFWKIVLWQVILAQITGRRTCYCRSQTFVKKHKIMRTFDIRYENGWFFHRSLVKAVRNRQSKQMKNWKLAF